MGSVKDMVRLKGKIGRFIFSDRYSVFDWGKMPDLIEDKGKSLCLSAAYFFERLEERGFKTHYMGIVEDGKLKRLDELKAPQNIMQFRLFDVIKPLRNDSGYDYSVFKDLKGGFLIPLEIIYRNALPPGSSVFKRLREGKLTPQDLGLTGMPKEGQILESPILDISTKLEETDRYLSLGEAKSISALTDKEMDQISELTLSANSLISESVSRMGLFNEDGKFEFAMDQDRSLVFVDALGTLDECRFTFKGIPVSKEIARIYYRRTSWFQDVENAKKRDMIRWKELVISSPPPLPRELHKALCDIYRGFVNELTQREWFKVPPLKGSLKIIKDFFTMVHGS